MTQPTTVLSDTTFVAVNVHARDSSFQCKVHAHTSIVALLPQLREHLRGLASGATRDYLVTEHVEWALEAGPIRGRLDSEKTLDEAGVAPGTDIYLTHRTRTESYPVLRDDLADGTAEVSKRLFAVIDGSDTRRLGVITLPAAIAAIGAIGIFDVLAGDVGVRWWVSGGLGVLALMCAMVAVVLTRTRENYGDVAGSLCVATYLATAGAAMVGVPRSLGVWHLTTVGASVATIAVVLWALTGNRPARLHVGVTAVAVGAVLIGVLHTKVSVSSQAVAAQMIFVALAVILWATQTSRMVGRVLVNYIPTTGEPLINRQDMSVAQVSRKSTSGAAIESMLNQEARVIETLNAMIGMVTAAGVTMAVSAFCGGYFTYTFEWHMFALVAAAAVVVIAVGRGLVIRAASLPLMVCGPVIWVAYLSGRALSPTRADNTVLLAGAAPLLIAVLLSAIWSIRQQTMNSPISKRRLERIATIAVIVVPPLLFLIMDGWSRVRNR